MTDTPLGARVTVRRAPDHLGAGVMLCLDMLEDQDTRHAEVFLDPNAQLDLARELLNKHFPETT